MDNEIKNNKDFKSFIRAKGRSHEVLIIDTDFAYDKHMEAYYDLQELFKEDKIPYGTAQKIFKIWDKLNWYGIEDVEMYEIHEKKDRIKLSSLGDIDND